MKNIKVKANVSSKTYNFENRRSRSYIADEELHTQFLLKGVSSDLWNVILTTQDYNKVIEYAKQRKISDGIDDFLYELQASNLLVLENFKKKVVIQKKEQLISNVDFDKKMSTWISNQGKLKGISLQLSFKCNMACKHCFNDKTYTQVQMSFEQAKKIIDEAYELGIVEVGLTGGECTVSRDFLKIAQYIRSKYLSLIILTNGQTLYDDEDFFENFVRLYPKEVKFSLYSTDPKVHDKITGQKGSHEKTISVMKRLRDKKIKVTLNYLQIKDNQGSLKNIIDFGKKFSFNVNVSSFFIQNAKNNNCDCRLNIKELEQLYLDKDFPLSVIHRTRIERPLGMKRDNRPICNAATTFLAIEPNLNVLPCNDFKYPLGNLKTQSLSDIWFNVIPKFRETFLRCNLESDCGTHEYCKNCVYCPLQASIENGFMKKSTSSCENAIAYTMALNKLRKKKSNAIFL